MSFLFPAEVDVFRARGLLPNHDTVPADIMKELYPDMLLDKYVREVCVGWADVVGMGFANTVAQTALSYTILTVRGSQPRKFLDFLNPLPIYQSWLPGLAELVVNRFPAFQALTEKHPGAHKLNLGATQHQVNVAVSDMIGLSAYEFISDGTIKRNGITNETVRVSPRLCPPGTYAAVAAAAKVRQQVDKTFEGFLWTNLAPVLSTAELIPSAKFRYCEREAAAVSAAVDAQFQKITLKSLVDNRELT